MRIAHVPLYRFEELDADAQLYAIREYRTAYAALERERLTDEQAREHLLAKRLGRDWYTRRGAYWPLRKLEAEDAHGNNT